ncbi:MAG: peptide chain release factor N(5)-glutamine methyltransferase [Alphaproteobacteria bacterium]|nr:peptide chain release factor N(5)-glutamine methyltransferase [Alphaproteobacteria bacterium]
MHISYDSLQEIVSHFQKIGIENPWREVRLLVSYVTGKSYEQVFFEKEFLLNPDQRVEFEKLVIRRANHEPLSKIIGYREFWGLNFKVTKDTLDPRPDTEILIEAVLKELCNKEAPLNCLDLGTGTGCLLLSILSEYQNATGVGVDISEEALKIAKENVASLGFTDRSTFCLSNWAENVQGVYDLIISNPPYIGRDEPLEKNVKDFDPPLALYAGKNGIEAYQILFSQIGRLCHPKTKIFMEIGKGQRKSVALIAKENGFILQNVYKDLAGIERVLSFEILK